MALELYSGECQYPRETNDVDRTTQPLSNSNRDVFALAFLTKAKSVNTGNTTINFNGEVHITNNCGGGCHQANRGDAVTWLGVGANHNGNYSPSINTGNTTINFKEEVHITNNYGGDYPGYGYDQQANSGDAVTWPRVDANHNDNASPSINTGHTNITYNDDVWVENNYGTTSHSRKHSKNDNNHSGNALPSPSYPAYPPYPPYPAYPAVADPPAESSSTAVVPYKHGGGDKGRWFCADCTKKKRFFKCFKELEKHWYRNHAVESEEKKLMSKSPSA